MIRRYTTLSLYVGREFFFSFLIAFLFFFFIFFMNNILILAEEVLAKNVPTLDVILLIVYMLPSVVSISFPFASLVGALMAVGRISSDNEILAVQASGISKTRLILPFLALGVIFTAFSFVTNDYFIPLGNINFGKLYRKILLSNPELELESFSVKRYQDSVIITGEVDNRSINNIIIIDESPEKNKRVISASEAVLVDNLEQRGVISLKLSEVFSHTTEANKKREYEYFESEEMVYNILLSDISFSVSNPGPREMSSVDVYGALQEKWAAHAKDVEAHEKSVEKSFFDLRSKYYALVENLGLTGKENPLQKRSLENAYIEHNTLRAKPIRNRSIHTYELEFYKKFSLPFGCIVFIIFAFPVGIFAKKSGRSVGFGIGLLVSIVYWGMLFAGQSFGFRMNFSSFLSM
ncbi:MAG: YjgP/YjgQ family permease, partial [Spirochaetales bacterium]|nr:YjgP/YjgQ family permease [Spirochaetales bacterium]